MLIIDLLVNFSDVCLIFQRWLVSIGERTTTIYIPMSPCCSIGPVAASFDLCGVRLEFGPRLFSHISSGL